MEDRHDEIRIDWTCTFACACDPRHSNASASPPSPLQRPGAPPPISGVDHNGWTWSGRLSVLLAVRLRLRSLRVLRSELHCRLVNSALLEDSARAPEADSGSPNLLFVLFGMLL